MNPRDAIDALSGDDDDRAAAKNDDTTGEDARSEARAVDEGDPTRTIVSNDPGTPETSD